MKRSFRAVGSLTLGGVALVRSFSDGDYWADFSTFVVRDGLRDDETDYEPVPAALNEYECHGGWGTAGRAGVGWFLAVSGDGRHRVVLEVHDAPPGLAGDQWSQVLETAYRSPTGTVGLNNVTDGPALETVELLGPGSYRLQVCRLQRPDEWDWLLRWWPCTPEEPPRWLRRDLRPWHGSESFAEDLIGVPAWSPGHRLSCTIGELADRLLLSAAQTRGAIDIAVRQHWLDLDGNSIGNAPFELAVPGGGQIGEWWP